MIHVLSKETIDKIAAGEVIERPESVVKELIENAVDSGATAVSAEIRDGGLSLIRITDNGCGIGKEEIPLAFMRHATSKLTEASDLFRITTMGFRGEALASICGVSEVELITKRAEELFGFRYEINGGMEKSLSEIGAPDGTSVIVRNLFYNVPARKKFLKSRKSEAAQVADVVEKAALSHPGISFRLVSDGKNLLHTSGNHRLKDVIFTIYGREISSNLIEISACFGAVSVSGYLGKPVIARAKRDYEIYFVNGRHIKSSVIEAAVEAACKPFMMLHRFPFCVLRIGVDPEKVDVNVHPKKMEVRFSENEQIYNAVFGAVSEALSRTELITETAPGTERPEKASRGIGRLPVSAEPKAEPFEQKKNEQLKALFGETKPERTGEKVTPKSTAEKNAPQISGETVRDGGSRYGKNEAPVCDNGVRCKKEEKDGGMPQKPCRQPDAKETPSAAQYGQETLFSDRFLSEKSLPKFRLIGQLFETYWLIEFQDKLYIIDQHAAHEKVNFERMMKACREKTPQAQMLLPPIPLSLRRREAELLLQNLSHFEALGYEIEEAGDTDFVVRAVPADLYSLNTKELLTELLDSLSEESLFRGTPELIREKLASMSCKAAVKGNRYLSEAEMRALCEELLTLENPYACPHGRPTIISMSKYELDRKFKRII